MNAVADVSLVRNNTGTPPVRSRPLSALLSLVAIFLLGFAVRYWYNFIWPHINDYAAGDAYEYLRNAGALLSLRELPANFWQSAGQCLLGGASPQAQEFVRHSLLPLNDLAISGAIFPAYLAICYVVAGVPFSISNAAPPLFGQCIISSFIGVFIALIGNRLFNRKIGVTAGILCALYPGFIVNSNRLYTETLAAFLLSTVCFLTVRALTKPQGTGELAAMSALNGVAAACLQFTRSIMVVLSAAVLAITFFSQGWKKGLPALAAFIVGFALVALPWLAFQKLAFGSATLVLDRAGHYNFFTGNLVESAGWLSFPYPNFAGMESSSLPKIAMNSFHRSPSRWLRLMQDKPLRMFKLPWNDYRKPIGVLDYHEQVLIHQALLLLSCIGVALGFVWKENAGADEAGRFNARVFLLGAVLLQTAYLMFITIPRYNLTTMPIVLLYSAVGINSLVRLAKSREHRVAGFGLFTALALVFSLARTSPLPWISGVFRSNAVTVGHVLQTLTHAIAIALLSVALWNAISIMARSAFPGRISKMAKAAAGCLLAVMVVISVPSFILPADANGRWAEWQTKLQPGQTIAQSFVIGESAARGGPMYLLIDARSAGDLQSVSVKINGKEIDAPRVPSIAVTDDFTHFQNLPEGFMRDAEWVFSCLTGQAGISNGDLRQWFIMPLPAGVIKPGMVEVQLQNTEQGHTPVIFGSYSDGKRVISIPSLSLYSWEKAFYGVENDRGFSDTRFNTKISGESSIAVNKDLSGEPGIQSGRYNIHLLASTTHAELTTKGSRQNSNVEKIAVFPLANATIKDGLTAPLYEVRPAQAYAQDEWWIVRLRALARHSGNGDLDVQFKVYCDAKGTQPDAKTSLDRNWGDQAATSPDVTKPYLARWTPRTKLDNGWSKIDAAIPIVPGSFGAPVKSVVCCISSQGVQPGQSELKDVSVEIVRLPSWPLQPGYKIY